MVLTPTAFTATTTSIVCILYKSPFYPTQKTQTSNSLTRSWFRSQLGILSVVPSMTKTKLISRGWTTISKDACEAEPLLASSVSQNWGSVLVWRYQLFARAHLSLCLLLREALERRMRHSVLLRLINLHLNSICGLLPLSLWNLTTSTLWRS